MDIDPMFLAFKTHFTVGQAPNAVKNRIAAALMMLSVPGMLLGMLLAMGQLLFVLFGPGAMGKETLFTVSNKTNRDLDVTPIGERSSEAERSLLPLMKDDESYLLEEKRSHFQLPAQGSVTFFYAGDTDTEDIEPSELIVHLPEGDRILVLHLNSTVNEFEIREISDLLPADPRHLAALERASFIVRVAFMAFIWASMAYICASFIVFPWAGWRLIKGRPRKKRVEETTRV